MTPAERRMAAALARLGVKFQGMNRAPRFPCVDPETGNTRHLFYLPHDETVEACARCGKERYGNEPRESLPQPPPRPFLDLECE